MKEYYIEYDELEFTIKGDYQKEDPQGYEFQGEPESFELYQILLDDKDITDIVSDYIIKELEERVIEEYYR